MKKPVHHIYLSSLRRCRNMSSKVISSGLYLKKYVNALKRYARPGCNSERFGYNVNVAPQVTHWHRLMWIRLSVSQYCKYRSRLVLL
jgi:hypothetical protein